jgi:enoyl-[acyl-carrier protein] reductase I
MMAQISGLMQGKRGVVLGVANNRSIAWGIAKACHAAGAEVALTWQGDALKKRVEPLAKELNGLLLGHCDVTEPATIDAVFDVLREKWGKIDFVVHAIAFSDKDQLDGRYLETTADNFTKTMLISCYSLTAIAQRAEKLLSDGGSIVTLTYYGAEKWMPHYNVMGVAKAALEASVRYLAADLGENDQDASGIRDRRLPLHFEVERVPRADAPHGHDRGSRRQRTLSALGSVAWRHRRGPSRRFRLSRRRHEAAGRA